MKVLRSAKIIKLFLLVFVFGVLIFPCKAQALKIEGSEWQALIQWKNPSEIETTDVGKYTFGKQGKVDYKYISNVVITSTRTLTKIYDRVTETIETRERETDKNVDIRTTGGNGTYTQNNTSIHLEFPDHTIDAVLKGNRMEGFITIKSTRERGLWDAEKTSTSQSGKIDDKQRYTQLLNDARGLRSQGKYRESLEKFTLATEIQSDDCVVFFERGEVKANLKDYRGAIADYDKFFQLGEYYLEQSKMKHSGYTWADISALMFESHRGKAYFNRGIAKNKLGDSIAACEDIQKSCELENKEACEMAKRVCNQR